MSWPPPWLSPWKTSAQVSILHRELGVSCSDVGREKSGRAKLFFFWEVLRERHDFTIQVSCIIFIPHNSASKCACGGGGGGGGGANHTMPPSTFEGERGHVQGRIWEFWKAQHFLGPPPEKIENQNAK